MGGRAAYTDLLATVAFTLVVASSAQAEAHRVLSAEVCSVYRQGPVVHRRMPVYYGEPSAHPSSLYFVDVWFRPEYLFDPSAASLPRPDGLPIRSLLFDVNVEDGQPLPLAYRRRALPSEDRFFTLLLSGGVAHLPLDRILNSFANSFLTPDSHTSSHIDLHTPEIHPTGEIVFGMERIEIPSAKIFNPPNLDFEYKPEIQDFYANFDNGGAITALMECTLAGSRDVPHCSLFEKSEYFEMSISGFRRNQLDQLELIRKHARNFTTCLTWEGE